jgi:RimJ/RimL family protein N-acetyltransferase
MADATTNEWGQPVGAPVEGWTGAGAPGPVELAGTWARLEPLDGDRHGAALWAANRRDDGRMWTYLAQGPFPDEVSHRAWLTDFACAAAVMPFAIIEAGSGVATGVAAYLRMMPSDGSIEVGHLAFSPALQRTTAATEAMALMMGHVFDVLGYRRYEWKCNALNAPSRRAAERLGFSFEGVFRQATVVKGRNRDTAWFAMTDADWQRLAPAFARWLHPDNFGPHGRQRSSLATLTAAALAAPRPPTV